MRPISTPLSRQVLVSLFTIIVASDGTDRVAAQGEEAAQIILLGDDTSNALLDLDPPPPPEGQVLVAGGDEGKVFAFVLGRDMQDAEDQLAAAKVTGEVERCGRGGVTCCDATSKTYVIDGELKSVIDGELKSERFWLRLGEICQGDPPEDGFDDGAPVGEATAAVVELAPAIISALAAYGVTHPFMTLAEESGNGRILVDPSYDSSGLSPPVIHADGRGGHPPIIPAGHVIAPAGCIPSVSWCKKDDGDRCNQARHHWFRWNDVRQKWCEMADRCSC